MCEKPKDAEEVDTKSGKDQPRSYYYDDAHGYEDFDPETAENEVDEDDESA